MEQDLRAVLLGNAAVFALVSDRVDWGSRRQGTPLPAAVLYVVSGAEGYTLKGADGLSVTRVQIDCYGDTYASAKTLSRAVVAALGGYSDSNFPGVFHVGTRDDREGGSNEADRPFRTSLDFNVNWRG